jgi:cellulose synthase/poly-beta-1,6-N-acetylglucosamine synthase-like glycosyltransferase/CheY-like chemotaxis protein
VIRVLVADDHLAVREGLHALLAKEREIAIVGEAGDGSTALELARRLKPDLIVLDDSMPGMGSLDVTRQLLAELPDTAVVFLARDPGMRDLALAAGATAFVSKDAPSAELLRALRASTAAVTARQQLSALRPEGRRVVELLLGSRVMTGEQVQQALAKRASGESLATTVVRLGLLGQPELADILARATDTPFVSLAPYPEISAPIDPTESRMSSPRLIDPVEREAARSVPLDVARGLGVVVTAADRGHGVVAMADPLDEAAFAEAQRHSRLQLTRVTATADDIKDTLDRVWNGGGRREVIWTGNLLSKVYASLVLGLILFAGIGGFGLVFRDALTPRFAFSLFALLCGFFFFLYALKYYVTIASVILITLFGDPAKFQGRHGNGNGNGNTNGNGLKADGHTNGNGHTNGQHKEGYRTLRGEKLSEAGVVVVNDPWQRMGEIRLPADRQPFVSIHLALYNEGRVVDRLLEACTSFDYENYEVIVADDSTDETVEKLKKWKEHPRVRVIHRSSRKGFKGGALQEALRRMNPHTEYVMVFDADFVPPADAIWHFLDYFGRLTKPKNVNGNGNGHNGHAKTGAPQNGDRLAVVQGYQWHMLNASENWVTKGVRAEFSGSYVLERAGQELFGAMKMISGSVYMIRADVLRKLGWSTSITEDWELTIRLYLAGYKVLYTPYIQAPAECVSEVRRLIKQRMRWAEGHTFNVRKYFWPILRSPNLSWQEKLEFVYYAPYYLQSVLFTVATVSWIVGVLILGQKLPMWGEIFGWSLVVSNALALPLMNLTGVLLEGSLKRDALGLLSFIGLSWILVPFQAYASLKALFEKKEGGWVRTPKSGRVTESLERFHLARLMPWELPRRKRGQSKSTSGTGRVAAAAVVVLAAAGIITVGALSIRATATSGAATENDLIVPAIIGTAVPLLVLALGWLRLRRRVTAIVLAFTLGLGTNVLYLAHAVPAAAVTDNSSVFTFRNTSGFGSHDMVQNYTPAAGAATTCPATLSSNWTCGFTSDTFTTGQTMSAGTAQADLYLENNPATTAIAFRAAATAVSGAAGSNSLTVNVPAGTQNGDFMIATVSVRDVGSGALMGTPAAGWTALRPMMDGGWTRVYMYTRVASSEPASYTWTFNIKTRATAAIVGYSGVDTANPVDLDAFTTQPSWTDTYVTPNITTTVADAMIVATFSVGTATSGLSIVQPTGMAERYDLNGGNSQIQLQESADAIQASAGATGQKTATASSSGLQGAGVAHIMALRPAGGSGPSCTVTATLKKTTPITLRAATTKTVNSGNSIVVDKPAGTQQNDLMFLMVTWNGSGTATQPGGWTLRSASSVSGQNLYTYHRVAGASEPATYTWTFNTTAPIAAWVGSYIGVDPTTPHDSGIPANQIGTTHTTGNFSTTTAGDVLVVGYTLAAVSTFSTPTGLTPEGAVSTSGSPAVTIAAFDMIQSGTGPVSQKTSTSSVSAQGANVIMAFHPIASNTVTLGSATTTLGSISSPTLRSISIPTSAATFATGERLVLEVSVPNDAADCGVRLSYDEAGTPSKLTVATIVPEGVLGLLLLAPGLPLAARWWKRRRP